jgi:hypothetical protein
MPPFRHGQSKGTLKDWCTGFKLPISGNKAILEARLREFSANRDDWQR